MKEILENLALIHLNNFAKEHDVIISWNHAGSHLAKNGRGFNYSLVRDSDGLTILTVTFHKNSTPTYSVNPNI